MTDEYELAQERRFSTWPYFAILAGACVSGILAVYLQPNDLWPARLILFFFWVVMSGLLFKHSISFLLFSPIAIMGGLSVFAYSVLPALIPIQAKLFESIRMWVPDLPPYLNSLAEALIILLSAIFLTILVFLAFYYRHRKVHSINLTLSLNRYVRWGLFFALCLSLIFQGLWSGSVHWPQLQQPTGILREIHHALPPLQTVTLTLLFIDALSRGAASKLGSIILIVGSVLILMSAGIAKIPFFHTFGLILGWFLLSTLSFKLRLGVISGILLFLFIFLAAAPFARPGSDAKQLLESQNKMVTVMKMFWSQALSRQLGTGRCLHDLMQLHWPDRFEGTPFYFVVGIVPRIIWPNKPSLSLGQNYAQRYCVTHPGDPHTASVSILGEPIIQAGVLGLVIALITLSVGLSFITIIAFHKAPYGVIALLSLIPWLIDFDQHFALFWANALKMSIVVLGVIAFVVLMQKKLKFFET